MAKTKARAKRGATTPRSTRRAAAVKKSKRAATRTVSTATTAGGPRVRAAKAPKTKPKTAKSTPVQKSSPAQPSAAARVALRRSVGPPAPGTAPSSASLQTARVRPRLFAETPLAGPAAPPATAPERPADTLPARETVGSRITGLR